MAKNKASPKVAASILDLSVEALHEFADALGLPASKLMKQWQPAIDKLSAARHDKKT